MNLSLIATSVSVIARHEGAGMPWYRGKILSLAGTKVNLLYVDYGQTEVGKIFGPKVR